MTAKQVRVVEQWELEERAEDIAQWMAKTYDTGLRIAIHGVPRGGVPAAYLVAAHARKWFAGGVDVVINPALASLFIDDIIDSGATMKRYNAQHPRVSFRALFEKKQEAWLVFPWEGSTEGSADDIPRRLLQFIGEDLTRPGLQETPSRFLRAWQEYTAGYRTADKDLVAQLKVFEDGAERVDEMVMVRDIPVYSLCEHHLAPFFGTATVGYIPNGRVLGLSKMVRLVEHYARRLQVQERLTQQIAHTLQTATGAQDVAVVVRCRHMCMEARGIRTRGAETVTSSMLGKLREVGAARSEFFNLAKGA